MADKIASDGDVTPLEVMAEAMRHHYRKGDLDRAAEIAKDCAPYVHPRLAAVAHKHSGGESPVAITVVEVTRPADGPALPR